MRKTIITLATIGGAYLLYKLWLDNKKKQEKKELVEPPSKVIEETIALAKKPKPKSIYEENWITFKSMKGCFNSDESATVAPSINAPKNGIF
jgi:hypothetical protein